MRLHDAREFADVEFFGRPHLRIGVEAFGQAIERRQEIPAAQLTGERGDQRVEAALCHQRQQLIEPLEVRGAHPLRVGLEEGPHEHDAQMVGTQRGDGVEVAADGIGIPVIPAKPPIVRGRVIDAEAMAVEVEFRALIRARGAGGAGAWAHGEGSGCCAGSGQEFSSVHVGEEYWMGPEGENRRGYRLSSFR